jgi:hypothetical protein
MLRAYSAACTAEEDRGAVMNVPSLLRAVRAGTSPLRADYCTGNTGGG